MSLDASTAVLEYLAARRHRRLRIREAVGCRAGTTCPVLTVKAAQ